MAVNGNKETANLKEFGKRLRIARAEKSLSLRQLAALSGIAVPTIQKYEAGAYGPAYYTFFKIAQILDVNVAWLACINDKKESTLQVNIEKAEKALAKAYQYQQGIEQLHKKVEDLRNKWDRVESLKEKTLLKDNADEESFKQIKEHIVALDDMVSKIAWDIKGNQYEVIHDELMKLVKGDEHTD